MEANGKVFNNGWWNCFSSMSAEIAGVSSSELDIIVKATLRSAGISKSELKEAIRNEYFDNRVLELLKVYIKDEQ